MKLLIRKRVYFRSEPHSMSCPKCGERMNWSAWKEPLGGWQCPCCGLKFDNK